MGEGPKLVWHRGKLAVSFIENGRRYRRSLGTDDIATARQRMADYLQAKDRHGKALNVAEIYTAYIQDRIDAGKAVGRMNDAWKRLEPTFGTMTAESVTKDICRTYAKQRRDQGISDGTIHLELGYLRAALTHAERDGLIDRAPYVPLPQKPAPRDHYIPKPTAPDVLAGAVMPHVRLFIIVALSTAGRAEAILDLTWDRVDFARRRIDLRDPSRPATPKGRAVPPMNETAFSALAEAKKAALSPYVIEWAGKKVGSIKKGVGEAGRRAGIKVTPHVLRHTAAVWMAEAGVPIPEIAQYLGHSNPTTTYKAYARYSPDYLQNAAKALEIQ